MQTIYAVEFYRGVGAWLSYEFVLMDDEEDDTQVILDNLIDRLSEEGDSAIMTLDEVEKNEIAEDFYTVGGNEGLAFVHNSAFDISKATYEQLTDNIPVPMGERSTEHLNTPYLWFKKGTTIADVIKGIKLYCAKQVWGELGNAPVREEVVDDRTEGTVLDAEITLRGKHNNVTFLNGTHIETVWHWIEGEFEVSVGEDLMSLEDEPIW